MRQCGTRGWSQSLEGERVCEDRMGMEMELADRSDEVEVAEGSKGNAVRPVELEWSWCLLG